MGDLGSIPGLGRSPREGTGKPLQYSCLENPMDGGAWWSTVHGVAKSRTQLSNFTHSLCIFKAHNFFIGIELLYKVVLVPAVQWVNQLYVYIYTLPLGPPSYPPAPLPLQAITEHWAELPVLYSSFPLAICLTHGSVYMSVLLCQFVLPSPVFICPLSKSASRFLPWK